MMSDPLDESHIRLASIVSSSDDAIIGKDLDGTITSWNAAAERLFGYSAEEAIGQSILLIVPPDRHQEEDDVQRTIRAGKGIDHFETVRQAKDGRLLQISLTVSPIKSHDGTVIGASKIARDVTLMKRLERDAHHFAAIVASSDDAIISKTLDGTVVTWNATAERLFGYSASEIVGRSIRLIVPSDRQEEEDRVLAAIRDGSTAKRWDLCADFADYLPDSRCGRSGHRRIENRPRLESRCTSSKRRTTTGGNRRFKRRCHRREEPEQHHHILECCRRTYLRVLVGGNDREVRAAPDTGRSSARRGRGAQEDSARAAAGAL
jgi:PAS domain S-box-containing protein